MPVLMSRLVLFFATLVLSFAAFVAFNFEDVFELAKALSRGKVPDDIELLAFNFYQSVSILVTGLFFTLFIDQFEKFSSIYFFYE